VGDRSEAAGPGAWWAAHARLPAVAGAFLVVLVAVIDLAGASSEVLIPLLVVGPLAAATGAWLTGALAVGALAAVAALGLSLHAGPLFTADHLMAIAGVGVAAALTATIVQLRLRDRTARRRALFLARSSDLLEAPPEPEAMLARVSGLAVPDMADLCIVDLLTPEGSIQGSVSDAADPEMAAALDELRKRFPLDPQGDHPVARVLREGGAVLLPEMSVDELRGYATSDEHFDLMRRLDYRSAIVIALRPRGRTLGVISFLRLAESDRYDSDDLQLLADVARRAALGVDNARLFAELNRTEAQLEGILGGLAEAVTVQDRTGQVVYANEAANRLVGLAPGEDLTTLPAGELLSRYEIRTEDGRPIDLEDLPGRRALRGELPEPLLLHQRLLATGETAWMLTKATPVRDEHDDIAFAVNVIEDVTQERRAADAQRFLSMATKLLASSLDVDVTLEKVAWAAVPEIADWCAVDMPDERGELRQVAVANLDPELMETGTRLRERYPSTETTGAPAVIGTGEAAFWPAVAEEALRETAVDEEHLELMRKLDMTSVIIVPMVSGECTIGAITFVTSGGRRLHERDLEVAEELGRRAGVAVENARLHATRTYVATTLQRSLLPPRLPVIPGLTVAARFRAAGETNQVGGDFYDLFPVLGDGWMVVMGDVTGKGPDAAAITSLARYTLRTAAMYERDPDALLARLNAALAHEDDNRQLCTAVCVRIDPAEAGVRLQVACAGHPAPYLLRPGGEVVSLGDPGTLLGAFDDADWCAAPAMLAPGEALVLYTDGVTDTRGEADRFGAERLVQLLRELTMLDPDEVAARVDDALLAFEWGPQRDDVAVLVLRADAHEGESATSLVGAAHERGHGI
jgi:PAS domain S-box-containing protein